MKIAIDFDGVIHEYSKGWTTGQIYDPPVKGAREALQQLKARGHTIYLFTTRTNSMFRKKDEPDQKLMIEEWMKQHDIPFDKIWTFGKPMADIFIDDRALHFRGDWNETLEQVAVFKVWNKLD